MAPLERDLTEEKAISIHGFVPGIETSSIKKALICAQLLRSGLFVEVSLMCCNGGVPL
jgi:hypothetical protein